jgi:hypothetical protein
MTKTYITSRGLSLFAALSFSLAGVGDLNADPGSIQHGLSTISTTSSTRPANGNVDHYGVATVETSTGTLESGNILVSNFNNPNKLRGTGMPIVRVAPNGSVNLFAHIDAATLPRACPGSADLTAALVVLAQQLGDCRQSSKLRVACPDSIGAGCLIVLNSTGEPVRNFSGSRKRVL